MEGAKSTTDVTSPPAGVGSKHEEVVTHESGTSGKTHIGTQQGSTVSAVPPGRKEETLVVEQETTRIISNEEDSPGNAKTSRLTTDKIEAPLKFLSGPPPPVPSSSASGSIPADLPVYESPPAATDGVEVAIDGSAGGEMLASGGIEGADTFTFTSSLPYLPTAAPATPLNSAAFHASPIGGANYEATRRAPTGERVAGVREGRESGFMEKLLSSFLSKRQERSLPLSPLSTGREDDIVEFVVQKPTTGGTAVPGFVVTKVGLYSSASPRPPPSRNGGFTQPAAYFDMKKSQQRQLLRKQQHEEEPLQDALHSLYVSVPPGAFVFGRATNGEEGKEAKLASLGGKKIPTFSSFIPSPLPLQKEAAPPAFWPPGLSPPPYSMLRAQGTERGGRMDFPPPVIAAQNLPFRMQWQVPKQTPQFGADVITVPVIPCREPLLPPLPAPRETVTGDKVVVPSAKSLLCFGHAGDEIKFCFGLLQLPPPAIKYDFLLEKKKTCFGLCETTGNVAVCRKCRMRLPECPFCHKQSAIRHP